MDRLRVRSRGMVPSIGAALLLLMIPACGPTEFHHPVYPAGGTVTYRGKPVEDAVVTFHPSDPAMIKLPEGQQGPEIAHPTTRTDASGKFTLSTYYAGDGSPAGDYRVTVAWIPRTLAVSTAAKPEGDEEVAPYRAALAVKDKLQGKYDDPKDSPLQASVKAEGANQFTFNLD